MRGDSGCPEVAMASARPSCSMRAAVMLLASAELTVAERRALRGLAPASNASDRRLQSCGSATFVADSSNCPSSDLQNCWDSVACGDLCEGDGECGTSNINNCGDWDVYRKDCPTTSTDAISCTSAKISIGQTRARTAARTTTTSRRSTGRRMRQLTRFVRTTAGSAARTRPERARLLGGRQRGTTRTGSGEPSCGMVKAIRNKLRWQVERR